MSGSSGWVGADYAHRRPPLAGPPPRTLVLIFRSGSSVGGCWLQAAASGAAAANLGLDLHVRLLGWRRCWLQTAASGTAAANLGLDLHVRLLGWRGCWLQAAASGAAAANLGLDLHVRLLGWRECWATRRCGR